MAYDLQSEFQKLGVPSTTDKLPNGPLSSCADGDNISSEHPKREAWGHAIQHGLTYTYPELSLDADTDSRVSAGAEDRTYVSTPPINVPSQAESGSENREYEIGSPLDGRYHEPSPLEELFHRGQTPASLSSVSPFQTIYQSNARHIQPTLKINTRPRGRSLLQEIARRPSRSPLVRTVSEADCANYDPITGEYRSHSSSSSDGSSARFSIRAKRVHSPLQTEAEDSFPTDLIDSQIGTSLTTQTTLSPTIEEVRTPSDTAMECLSPMQIYSPFNRPNSLEDTSAWPRSSRQIASSPKAKSYNVDRNGSFRSSRRSSYARRSTSTSMSMSPATAFLSKWGREEAVAMPDDEGQEVGDYVLGKEIGFGGFSTVREAYTPNGDQRLRHAVKIVRKQLNGKGDLENDRLQAELDHEIELWRCLSHRHILPLITVHITDFATYCFTQLNTGGTLFDLVKANRQGNRKDLARRYTYQLASAIRYLHEDVRVVHRDVKLENCLIDLSNPESAAEGGNLLLCDFGLAEFINSDTRCDSPGGYDRHSSRSLDPTPNTPTSNSIAGSLQYASPELILSPVGLLNPAVDIWAFGVVVYALLVGDLPFQHMFQPRVQMMILAGDCDFEKVRRKGGEDVEELVRGCLTMRWEDRWTIGQALDCAWLNGCREMLEEVRGEWN
ncbi:MAG: hypothetical protein MMC33_005195 [Icmadophila ericetorum]|nr:hypothetical protein [Icmadophila ericetorum]